MAIALLAWAGGARAERFTFVAYGDTSYTLPRDHDRNLRLVAAINAERPAFSIHVGDFKGYTICDDAAYRTQIDRFARHDHPVVMTPGDNDWADCWGEGPGGFDPLERLQALRRIFFAADRSLGGTSMPVARQSAAYPENMRWTHGGIVFATVHAVGPANGLVVRDRRLAVEAVDRTSAGERWIEQAFQAARESKAPALVLAFQVDPWITGAPTYADGPLDWIIRTIREEAASFPGQVLVVHGDSHRFIVDHPIRRTDTDAGTTVGLNVTRLQVPGWPDHRAVAVEVDTERLGMFGFREVFVPEEAHGAKP